MVTKTGLAGVIVIFVAGLWLLAAPFALRFQPPGAGLTVASRTDVIIGGVLAVAGFAGFFAIVAGRVRELYSGGRP